MLIKMKYLNIVSDMVLKYDGIYCFKFLFVFYVKQFLVVNIIISIKKRVSICFFFNFRKDKSEKIWVYCVVVCISSGFFIIIYLIILKNMGINYLRKLVDKLII